MMRIVDACGERFCGFAALGFLIYFLMLCGCIERQELRGQQCAHLCIDRHGVHGPEGVVIAPVHGDRCSCKLRDGRVVREGRLDPNWRPE